MSVIEEIRAGNKETIKAVYKENVKDVYNFAKSITGNHETALEATKKTFVILFNRIQKGMEPTNIRLAALKIAYDEACAIAMPSTEAIDSPYDKEKSSDETTFKVNNAPKETSQSGKSDEIKFSQEEAPGKETVKEEPKTEKAKEEILPENGPEKEEEKAAPKVKQVYDEPSNDEFDSESGDEEDEYDAFEHGGKRKKRSAVSVILLIINIILVLILVWFILGLLQNMEIIPENINMGHEWFNNNIYPLF